MSVLETVIGLEIHVQLATRTKLFCADVAEFGAEPNTHVCPVCLGLPGALPVVNEAAVRLAVRAALGLNCEVHERSVFARKNYFYPDLPKGYQITQLERPLATGGWLDIEGAGEGGATGRVRIQRVHLEEDAGKSLHDRVPGRTGVDLNRAGVPLIEIVTEPDLESPAGARAFLTRLKQVLAYLEVSDCDMEKGSLRVDANLSIRASGSRTAGIPTEVKNMNSFAHVEQALRFEEERQRSVLRRGGTVARETLLWDAEAGEARRMRTKDDAMDYRYFAEPDLPPLIVPADVVEAARDTLPELPAARALRFRQALGLPAYDAEVLTASRGLADYFEEVFAEIGEAKTASNWVMTDVLAWLNDHGADIADFPVAPAGLGEVIGLVRDGTVSRSMGRALLGRVAETGRSAREIVEAEGLAQVSDASQLQAWVDAALADHPDEARRLREGERKLLGFFMGQVMERSGGKADPRTVGEVLRQML